MGKIRKLTVLSTEISVVEGINSDDFICLTDMVKASEDDGRAADIIKNWIRNRATIEFLGAWESLYNPKFKVVEFDHFRKSAGLPTFTMSVANWVESTGAIGIYSKSGRYGGTYAHKDIAFEFGAAISPMFKLYLIKDYQRLKEEESNPALLQWHAKRFLSKANYAIHTDAIQMQLKHLGYKKAKEILVYAQEADMLNVVVFGCTAKEWESKNPQLARKRFNIRETASVAQLLVLSNLETINAEFIKKGISRSERFRALLKIAEEQLETLKKREIDSQFRKQFPENNVGKLLNGNDIVNRHNGMEQ
ncbi:KilA-N domain-containing protein [Prevotella multiformis]|uniref:KilA-N domain-containing protein n=1 Tax=Prevotella multiformis TaxID=282402 RepID=UPI001BA86509|nr:KilA-N domain-containing protein [Prevotella multiformis]QUB70868.1 KilA-N domain-containing protein [Prevotella multiformis]